MGSYEQTMIKLEKMAQTTNAKQMSWQEKMTKNSHQMEVDDLVKAGLNPVLSSGGSGAQSYTTSLDSAASAVAGLASAHESATASRFAARQSAAATRAAAAANLAAAREAAAAQRYSADKAYQSKIESSPVATVNKAVKSMASFFGITDYFKAQFGKDVKAAKNLAGNEKIYLRDENLKHKWSYENLTLRGKANVARILRSYGFDFATRRNSQIYLDAFMNNDKKSQRQWEALVRKANKLHSNSGSSYRYGH